MSFELYSKWWIKTKQHVDTLKQKDQVLEATTKPTQNRNRAGALAGGLYARYCILVQEIDTCLDQMCQAQKRITVHKLMDAAFIRLKELKEELVNIDLSEFHYIDGNMIELKIVPHDVEIMHPALFYHRPIGIQEMWERFSKGERIYVPPAPISSGLVLVEKPLDVGDAKSEKIEVTAPTEEDVIKPIAAGSKIQFAEGEKPEKKKKSHK